MSGMAAGRPARRRGRARAALGLIAVLAGWPAGAAGQCGGYYALQAARIKASRDSMLVSVDWLASRKPGSVVVLHADRNAAAYDSAHVPGARLVRLSDYVVDRDSLLSELPPVERLVDLFESLGVGNDRPIVITGELLSAARLWFTLDYLGQGHRAVLLDGGLAAWRTRGHPVEFAAPAAPTRVGFAGRPVPEKVVDAAWVDARRSDRKVAMIDARTPAEFRGEVEEKGVPRNGHIPGSRNLDWTTTLDGGVFKDTEDLLAMFEGAGADPGDEVVALCRVGTRASVIYFLSRMLGYRTRMYDGSLNDWSRRGLPLSTGASP